jgi:hypothetical protein
MKLSKRSSCTAGLPSRRAPSRLFALSLGLYASIAGSLTGLSAASAVAAPAVPVPASTPAASVAVTAKQASASSSGSMSITAANTSQAATSLVTVSMPTTAQATALHVFLNGADITGKFAAAVCTATGTITTTGMQCLTAQLGSADGLRQGKNVLQAEGKTSSGALITARTRFDNQPTTGTAAPAAKAKISTVSMAATSSAEPAVLATSTDVVAQSEPVQTPFTPPTVGFKMNYYGGYNGTPWFNVGGTNYPQSAPSCGAGIWTVVVLDRQTLVEKTNAPESSPQCFTTNAAMTAYLKSLPQGDFVVAGTNQGAVPDGTTALDTTPIGGTNFGGPGNNPANYTIIGATGVSAGSAFEPHDVPNGTAWLSQPRGILQEDANGDYNFFSGDGDFVRYAVVPNAPAGAFNNSPTPVTTIQISITGAQHDSNPNTAYISYTPPAGSNNGFWLLRLNRGTLERLDNCSNIDTSDSYNYQFSGCGKFYQTNAATYGLATGAAAMKQLAADLKAYGSDPWQLLFLTTVGQPNCCDWQTAVGQNGANSGDTGFGALSSALQQMGGTPAYATYGPGQNSTNTPLPAYTLVTATGLGNPQSGPVAESSTFLLSTHGQTGTISGTLERDNDAGLFTPGQINQEFTSVLIDKGGLDNAFVLNTTALTAPVDWPEESQTVQISGADSIAGQIGAYRFISLSLLNDKYVLGISGSHQDDLHYFFTSSLNTSINYHYFDPIDLPWPGSNTAGFTQCTNVDPTNTICSFGFGTGDTVTFTVNDFNAVRAQMSLEVRDLTNVLQYLITGSTNMRDSVIGGNANVGLALTGAAATVLGNQLMPVQPTTSVDISWQSILGTINGGLNILAGLPGLGELTLAEDTLKGSEDLLKLAKQAGAWTNEIAGAAGLASGAGSIKTSSTTTSLPSKYAKFALEVGQLADGALQNQLSHGFDAMVDSILSDWGRLATIGPRTVNVDDDAFFVPNQVVQEVVLDGITSGAERNFYAALMPSFFEVDYWPGVGNHAPNGVVQPDMGYYQGHTDGPTCYAFYLDPPQTLGNGQMLGLIPAYVSTYAPSPEPITQYFTLITPYYDQYLISKGSTSKGSDTEQIPTIDPNMGALLFGPQGLNIPMMQFVQPNGPMQSKWYDAGTTDDVTTHSKDSICASGDPAYGGGYGGTQSVQVGSAPSSGGTSGSGSSAGGSSASSPSGGGSPSAAAPNSVQTETTLVAPDSSLLGSAVTLNATVMAATTPVPEGTMYFRIDGSVAASVPLQSDGSATYTTSTLALGSHTIQASYGTASSTSVYDASSSSDQTLSIYADGPDLKLSTSASSMSVARGNTSSPVTVSLTSINGAAGNVSLACSGLPVGAICAFSPSQISITDGGTATTSMTVSVPKGTATAAALGLLGLMFMPALTANATRRRKLMATWLVFSVVASGLLTGCGGDNTTTNVYEVPTGTVHVLISATVNGMTRTVPVSVTISN